jgi:peptide/nickel transport system permease protein
LTLIFLVPLIFGFYQIINYAFLTNDVSSSIGYILILIIVIPVFWSLMKWSVHLREVTYVEMKKESAPRTQETKRMMFLLRKSPLAIAGLIMIATLVALAVLAPVIAPEHWDPKYAEIPNAQPYFRLMSPSLSVSQQYDLYVQHMYNLYSDNDVISLGIDSSGTGYLVANATAKVGKYTPYSGSSNVSSLTVLPESAVLADVKIVPNVDRLPVRSVTRFTAHATSADGKEMDTAFAWSKEGNVGNFMQPKGRVVDFIAGNSSAAGKITVKATYNNVVKESSLTIEILTAPEAWSVASATISANSSIAETKQPKRITVDAFAVNGSVVPSSQYNVTWKITALPGTFENLYSIALPSTRRGFAVGENGTIIRTTDGGTLWKNLNSPDPTVRFNDVAFTDSNQGWVVGGSGVIFATSNSGDLWTRQTSGVGKSLNSVWFSSQMNGWVVGDDGIILNTSDSGQTWIPQTSGANVSLKGVAFYGSTGLAVGDGGTILRTTDGGANCSIVPSGVATSLTSVYIASQNISYVTGTAGVVLKTAYGGVNWSAVNTGVTNDLYSAYFFDKDFGLVCGTNGLLLRTTSGGVNWEQRDTNTTATLYSISSQKMTEETSFIVGSHGTLLVKKTSGWVDSKPHLTVMYGNETELLSSSPGEVKLSATIKTSNATITLYSQIYVYDIFVILSNKIDGSPNQVTAKRGELFSITAIVKDEYGYPVTDSSIAWSLTGSIISVKQDQADAKGESPSTSERLTVANAKAGYWRILIVNRGDTGPFYLRAEGFYSRYDFQNGTDEQFNVFFHSCGENMQGDPIKAKETRTYCGVNPPVWYLDFTAQESLDELHVDLIGPKAYIFGTDENGRDYTSLILYGMGISMRIAITVVISAVMIGVLLGGVSGYFGGKLDELLMRITDVFLSIPGLILAMAVAAVLGRSLDNIMYALIVVWWPGYTRLIRGQALSVRENLYVEAARSVGASESRIIIKHIIPNCLSPVLVNATLDIGSAVLVASGLSFIGFGALYPVPELGLLISTGRNRVFSAPWLVTLPGIAIFVFVLGFNLFGDGLRDLLDPRLRE